jgi:hypothetical protein
MAHEAEVAENNLRLHAQMKRKGAASAKSFEDNEIATLFIPRKLRLATEQPRLTVRIINNNGSGYKLLTRFEDPTYIQNCGLTLIDMVF